MLTIDFHFGERHNVRGWEFGWPDFIALGLIFGHNARAPLRHLVGPLTILWIIHFIILEISALRGIDPLFSHYAIARQLRSFLVLTAATACIRSWRDGEAVIAGLAIVCLINEWRVLQQKYLFGRFQCIGSFDPPKCHGHVFDHGGPHSRLRTDAQSGTATPDAAATDHRLRRGGPRRDQLAEPCWYADLGRRSDRCRAWGFLGGINAHKLRLAGIASCLGSLGWG